ncbi:DinB family protein [Oceanihabitans sediminis]|uniref:DinB family protein n=1 Tax=Oceanihabitans sediminis TaxID=1812012 RepID=UPI00299E238A|nr:DinB family protein [Oceanihabitans sediminis]MDX1277274.1 DinB family protein [Oceanihabitans sediminis]MDX1773116.1 DinB family protein [Oceanihabitans sediminis]
MDWAFEIALKNRKLLKNFIDNHSLEELNKVPEGFSNNIIWNIAHTIVTQQLLVYKLSGLPSVLSDEMIETYRKGTKTEGDVSQEEIDEIAGFLFSTIEKMREDYNNNLFQKYTEYTVSTGSTLTNAEEAIHFNNFHEGIHLGYILALRKSL